VVHLLIEGNSSKSPWRFAAERRGAERGRRVACCGMAADEMAVLGMGAPVDWVLIVPLCAKGI